MRSDAPVAIDAMGGDHAPRAIVQGAIQAARQGSPVLLVGPEPRLREEFAQLGADPGLPISLQHASQVVQMDDSPGQAMRRLKDSSLRVCFDLVKRGEASAVVSAGNSGATLAGALFFLGRAGAVERPAIVTLLPTLTGRPTVLLDAGANVECKPGHLVQFALMGELFARRVLGVERPKVAMLANGEEESKGTELTRAADRALRRAPVDYRGYCEGRDLLTGTFDVVATDGYTGNVALKTMEGTAKAVVEHLRRALRSTAASKVGGLLARGALDGLRRQIDWREVGGAELLGVNGVCIIAHGMSDARAIENAIHRAEEAARSRFTDEIGAVVARSAQLLDDSARAAPPKAPEPQSA